MVPIVLLRHGGRDTGLVRASNRSLKLTLSGRARHLHRYVHLVTHCKALRCALQLMRFKGDLTGICYLVKNKNSKNRSMFSFYLRTSGCEVYKKICKLSRLSKQVLNDFHINAIFLCLSLLLA